MEFSTLRTKILGEAQLIEKGGIIQVARRLLVSRKSSAFLH